jgi:hypothetical protein
MALMESAAVLMMVIRLDKSSLAGDAMEVGDGIPSDGAMAVGDAMTTGTRMMPVMYMALSEQAFASSENIVELGEGCSSKSVGDNGHGCGRKFADCCVCSE